MAGFQWNFGGVNERIMCCKYLFHTKMTPGFCHKFNQRGLNLDDFCNKDLWKGRYTNLRPFSIDGKANAGGLTAEALIEINAEGLGTPHVNMEHPVEWEIEKSDGDGKWICVQTPELLKP